MLYNNQSLSFTGNNNPYGLIQKAGKKRRMNKSKRKLSNSKRMNKKRMTKRRN